MKIAVLVEGKTEDAFKEKLREFLSERLQNQMPRLQFIRQNGRIPKENKLKRLVENLLRDNDFDAVIALTDVYTGTDDFSNAGDAKTKMQNWVGDNPNFYPCAAQYDFEAWLLPYWSVIQARARHNKTPPSGKPEAVNHGNSPSYRINEVFRLGLNREYNKIVDAKAILKNQDLMVAISACPELKHFINCILRLCDPIKVIP